MITERLGRHTIKLWETIDELPIDRFTAWNKYMMIDSSIGSTFEEIETKHLGQLVSIIDDKPKALQQIANLRELVFSVLNKVNYQHHAYCCMVHAIDGEEMTDYSDTGIKEMLKKLDKIGVTNGNIKKKMNPLKKVFIQISKRFSQISSTGPGSTTIMKS